MFDGYQAAVRRRHDSRTNELQQAAASPEVIERVFDGVPQSATQHYGTLLLV